MFLLHFLYVDSLFLCFCLSWNKGSILAKSSSHEQQASQSPAAKHSSGSSFTALPTTPSLLIFNVCVSVCLKQGVSTSGVWAVFSFGPVPMVYVILTPPPPRLPCSSLSSLPCVCVCVLARACEWVMECGRNPWRLLWPAISPISFQEANDRLTWRSYGGYTACCSVPTTDPYQREREREEGAIQPIVVY